MLNLVQPVAIPEVDKKIRAIVDHVRENGPIPEDPPRPEELPDISLMLLVKDEHETMYEAVKSTMPLPTEIIIGVDKSTDSALSLAYREAYKKKPGKETDEFFFNIMLEERYATVKEIARYLGENEEQFQARVLDMQGPTLKDRPTYKEAKRCLDLVGNGKIIEIDFNDHFSESRNRLLKKCTGEIVFFLDGHEFLTDPYPLMQYLVKAEATMPDWLRYGILVEMRDSPEQELIRQDRIFKNVVGARFERGVHNKLMMPGNMDDERMPTADQPRLHHLRPAWLQRYREIQRHRMVKKHMAGKDDYSSSYYEGATLHKLKKFDEAKEKYLQYLRLTGPSPEQAVVYSLIARIDYGKGDLESALENFHAGTLVCHQAAWCWAGMSHIYMEQGQAEKDEDEQRRLYEKALFYSLVAKQCESPKSTIAIPQRSYGWEGSLRIAEIYSLMGNQNKFFEWCEKALSEGMPDEKQEEVRALYSERQRLVFNHMSQHLRRSGTNGKPALLVVDRMGQFSDQVFDIGEKLGYEVKGISEYSYESILWADVIWCDWADENAVYASNTMRGDRKLIVRCHSYESFGDVLPQINWANVDAKVTTAPHVARKIAMKYGVDDWGIVPVVPNPDSFPTIIEGPGPGVVFLGRFGPKKWPDRLLDLSYHLTDEHEIHIGGTIQDERSYDGIVAEAFRVGRVNMKFYGHIDASERTGFLTNAPYYVSLSPWEGDSVAMMEAQLMGHTVLCLANEWNDDLTWVTKTACIEDMARLINGQYWSPTPREAIEEKYHNMRSEIETLLQPE